MASQVIPGKKYMGGKFHSSTCMLTICTLWAAKAATLALTGSGEFSESAEDLKKYQVEAPKYRKEYIDRARIDVAQEREKNKWDTALNQNFIPPVYDAVVHNCQHYFAEVLQQAQKYETREKPLVLP